MPTLPYFFLNHLISFRTKNEKCSNWAEKLIIDCLKDSQSFFLTYLDMYIYIYIYIYILYIYTILPDMGAGCYLEPEGNGVSLGEGDKRGPGPQEAREISSRCLARAETTWTRTRKKGQVGCDEERSARTK
jgi:hypothetical protein